MPKKLLEGIKVVDFGWSLVGPLISKDFADWGAEVIRIESSTRVGLFRTLGHFKDDIEGYNRNGIFNQVNTSKLGVTINLALPRGKELAKRFVARADIVVENFAGGAMERMGLSYEELQKVKPDIIMVRSSMFGQKGPWSSAEAFGSQGVPLAGFSHLHGWPDRKPAASPGGGPDTDYIAPSFCVLAAVGALLYRHRTGKGQCIDLAQYETGIHFLAPTILDYTVNQQVAMRKGNHCDYAAPHGIYRCIGEFRWCAIAVFTDEEWNNFCRIIGNPLWTDDPKFNTFSGRKENEDELDKLIETWTLNHSPEEIMNTMQTAGVSAGVVQNAEDLLIRDPHMKHRQLYRELDHPEVGKYWAYGPTFQLSKCDWEMQRAFLMGEHNEYALKEIIGLSDDEIAELVIEGVLE